LKEGFFEMLKQNFSPPRGIKNLVMVEKIESIVKQNPFGFTYSLKTGRFVKFGYSVAYEATQNSFERPGLEKVLEHALKHSQVIGGWLNTENNLYYYDSVKIFKRLNEAMKFARENHQVAIFDLTNLIEIRVIY
jgi:hypothetical protein